MKDRMASSFSQTVRVQKDPNSTTEDSDPAQDISDPAQDMWFTLAYLTAKARLGELTDAWRTARRQSGANGAIPPVPPIFKEIQVYSMA